MSTSSISNEFFEKHRDEFLEFQRKEIKRISARKYRDRNREKVSKYNREYGKRYRLRNKGLRKETGGDWGSFVEQTEIITRKVTSRAGLRIMRNEFFEICQDDLKTGKETFVLGKTDFEKICEGDGDYYFYFYGHVNEEGSYLDGGMVFNLKILRKALIDMSDDKKRSAYRLIHPTEHSSFYAFSVKDFPKEMVLATSKKRGG